MDVVNSPHDLQPGFKTDFKFSLQVHSTTESFRALTIEQVSSLLAITFFGFEHFLLQRNCHLPDENFNENFDTKPILKVIKKRSTLKTTKLDKHFVFQQFTTQGCLFDCMIRKAYGLCGCIPWDYPVPPGYLNVTLCYANKTLCFQNAVKDTIWAQR